MSLAKVPIDILSYFVSRLPIAASARLWASGDPILRRNLVEAFKRGELRLSCRDFLIPHAEVLSLLDALNSVSSLEMECTKWAYKYFPISSPCTHAIWLPQVFKRLTPTSSFKAIGKDDLIATSVPYWKKMKNLSTFSSGECVIRPSIENFDEEPIFYINSMSNLTTLDVTIGFDAIDDADFFVSTLPPTLTDLSLRVSPCRSFESYFKLTVDDPYPDTLDQARMKQFKEKFDNLRFLSLSWFPYLFGICKAMQKDDSGILPQPLPLNECLPETLERFEVCGDIFPPLDRVMWPTGSLGRKLRHLIFTTSGRPVIVGRNATLERVFEQNFLESIPFSIAHVSVRYVVHTSPSPISIDLNNFPSHIESLELQTDIIVPKTKKEALPDPIPSSISSTSDSKNPENMENISSAIPKAYKLEKLVLSQNCSNLAWLTQFGNLKHLSIPSMDKYFDIPPSLTYLEVTKGNVFFTSVEKLLKALPSLFIRTPTCYSYFDPTTMVNRQPSEIEPRKENKKISEKSTSSASSEVECSDTQEQAITNYRVSIDNIKARDIIRARAKNRLQSVVEVVLAIPSDADAIESIRTTEYSLRWNGFELPKETMTWENSYFWSYVSTRGLTDVFKYCNNLRELVVCEAIPKVDLDCLPKTLERVEIAAASFTLSTTALLPTQLKTFVCVGEMKINLVDGFPESLETLEMSKFSFTSRALQTLLASAKKLKTLVIGPLDLTKEPWTDYEFVACAREALFLKKIVFVPALSRTLLTPDKLVKTLYAGASMVSTCFSMTPAAGGNEKIEKTISSASSSSSSQNSKSSKKKTLSENGLHFIVNLITDGTPNLKDTLLREKVLDSPFIQAYMVAHPPLQSTHFYPLRMPEETTSLEIYDLGEGEYQYYWAQGSSSAPNPRILHTVQKQASVDAIKHGAAGAYLFLDDYNKIFGLSLPQRLQRLVIPYYLLNIIFSVPNLPKLAHMNLLTHEYLKFVYTSEFFGEEENPQGSGTDKRVDYEERAAKFRKTFDAEKWWSQQPKDVRRLIPYSISNFQINGVSVQHGIIGAFKSFFV